MGLEKAFLVKAGHSLSEKISVLFNPSQYVISTANTYKEETAPGTTNTIIMFKKGGLSTLSMTLYFDTYTQTPLKNATINPMQTIKEIVSSEREDVRMYTDKVLGLMKIDPEKHAPPEVVFAWGSLSFNAIITSVKEKYTMFLPSGQPVRAQLDVDFRGIKEALKKTVLHSPDRTKQRAIRGTDQLWNMASQEYDDPAQWRVIARENGILNPRNIEHGTVLKVPSIT